MIGLRDFAYSHFVHFEMSPFNEMISFITYMGND